MKKFLIGLVTGLLLAGVTLFVGFFALVKFGDRKPMVAEGSTLYLRLEGEVPEKAPMEFPIPFFDSKQPVTVQQVWEMLEKAAVDSRVKAVVLEPQGLSVGWAKLQEIRGKLVDFKKSGKPLFVYLRAPRTPEYYLATAADQVYMTPTDLLYMKGLRAESMYLKGTLDKIGVQFEVEHAGKYKDAGDMFTRKDMSPETREVMSSVLDRLYAHLTETIAASRKKSVDEVKGIMDTGPFLATEAKTKGLVDDLIFDDQFEDMVKKKLGQTELKKLSYRDYAKTPVAGFEGKSKIAFLVGEGNIMRNDVTDAFGNESGLTPNAIIRQLREVGKDSSIQGVIFRVDSPGGDAVASEEILREVQLLSRKKPLVISMSDVAASGGYYVAMTGDPVLAYSNTLTGSIGVIYGRPFARGLYDKIGITKDSVQRGKNADIDSDYRPMTPEARQKLREGIFDTYKTFVSHVAQARKKKFDDIEALAQGRVWLGSQAKENALVDELGGIDRAIQLVKLKAKIAPSEKVRLVVYPPRRSLFEQLMTRDQENAAEALVRQEVMKTTGLDVRLFRQAGMLRLMPYTSRVQ